MSQYKSVISGCQKVAIWLLRHLRVFGVCVYACVSACMCVATQLFGLSLDA